jgi:hypothetical protein
MDLTSNKPLIVSAGINHWYPQGVERLHRSAVYNGYAGDLLLYKGDYPFGSPSHQEMPYAFKIAALREGIKSGYNILLWCDSSVWMVKNPHDIFDIIIDKGVFGFRSGYNLAQTATDRLLRHMNWTRDYAEGLPEIASGIVGLFLDNPNGRAVFDKWAELCDAGMFAGSRTWDYADSNDPRFLHGRQDQSAFSAAIHYVGVEIPPDNPYVAYYGGGTSDESKLTFRIGGL